MDYDELIKEILRTVKNSPNSTLKLMGRDYIRVDDIINFLTAQKLQEDGEKHN